MVVGVVVEVVFDPAAAAALMANSAVAAIRPADPVDRAPAEAERARLFASVPAEARHDLLRSMVELATACADDEPVHLAGDAPWSEATAAAWQPRMAA